MIKPALNDIVQLKDGRTGTILFLYADGLAAEIEFEDPSGETVELSEIEKVVQKAIK